MIRKAGLQGPIMPRRRASSQILDFAPRAFYTLTSETAMPKAPTSVLRVWSWAIYSTCAVLFCVFMVHQGVRMPYTDMKVTTKYLDGWDCSMLSRQSMNETLGTFGRCGETSSTPSALTAAFASVLSSPYACLRSLHAAPPTFLHDHFTCHCIVDDPNAITGASLRSDHASCATCSSLLAQGTRPCSSSTPADAACFEDFTITLTPPPYNLTDTGEVGEVALGWIDVSLGPGLRLWPRCSLLSNPAFASNATAFLANLASPESLCGRLFHLPPYACTRPRRMSAFNVIATAFAATCLCYVILVAACAFFLRLAYRREMDVPGSPEDREAKHRQGYEDTALEESDDNFNSVELQLQVQLQGMGMGPSDGHHGTGTQGTQVRVQPPSSTSTVSAIVGLPNPQQRRAEGTGMGAETVEMV